MALARRLQATVVTPVTTTDPLPNYVVAFVEREGMAAELLSEVHRHVTRVTRPYPDAYFALRHKDPAAIDDLTNRVFTVCARVEKGRFPFSGRTPFGSYVEERFDGRTIRYHSFYARLSITREMIRDDYAHNVRRDPVLRWRAELFRKVGAVLRERCVAAEQGRGLPPRWQLADAALRALVPLEIVEANLQESGEKDIEELVIEALRQAGPLTQSRLTYVVEAVLGTPPAAEPAGPEPEPVVATTTFDVRRLVLQTWGDLDKEEQDLLSALARGASYDELISTNPAFQHRVAVSRAVNRVGRRFLDRIADALEQEADLQVTPKALIELVLEVLVEVLPEIEGHPGGTHES